MLAELESVSKEIEEDRQALETELAAQQEIKDALAEQEKTLEAQRAEADALLLDLAAAYDNLTDEYLANEAQEEALRKEIMEAQAAYEAALSAEEAERLAQQNQNNVAGSGSSSNVTPSSSGFVSPLPAASAAMSPAPMAGGSIPFGATAGSTAALTWLLLRVRRFTPLLPAR